MLNHKVPACLAHILKLLSKYVCTLKNRKSLRLNTQYATDSTLLCPVKMEYGPENNIFVQKNVDEKWSRKNYFESPPCAKPFLEIFSYFIERGIFASNCKFNNKNDLLCAWRDFNKTFCDISTCHK